MPDVPNAARVGDPIEHTNALMGALTGLAAGALLGGAIAFTMILTAGTAAPVILGAFSVAATLSTAGFTTGKGMWEGSSSRSGSIGEGAATVFIGAGSPPAARVLDPLHCGDSWGTIAAWGGAGATTFFAAACVFSGPVGWAAAIGVGVGLGFGLGSSEHEGAQIADGSKTVLIERRPAARVGDRTSCSGTIAEGCSTVFIGGPRVRIIPEDAWSTEVPVWLERTMFVLDKIGFVTGLLSVRSAFFIGLAGFDALLMGAEMYFLVTHQTTEAAIVGEMRMQYEVVVGLVSAGWTIRGGLLARAGSSAARGTSAVTSTATPTLTPTVTSTLTSTVPLPRTPPTAIPAGATPPVRPVPNLLETPQLPALPKPKELLALPKPKEMLALPPGNPAAGGI